MAIDYERRSPKGKSVKIVPVPSKIVKEPVIDFNEHKIDFGDHLDLFKIVCELIMNRVDLERVDHGPGTPVRVENAAPVPPGPPTAHTCGGPRWGRKTPGCPRCDELIAGAEPRRWGIEWAS